VQNAGQVQRCSSGAEGYYRAGADEVQVQVQVQVKMCRGEELLYR